MFLTILYYSIANFVRRFGHTLTLLNENYTGSYMLQNLIKKEFPYRNFTHISIAFILTIIPVRIYEYIFIASELFVNNSFQYELAGILYDIWNCLIYSCIFLLPYFLFSLISKKLSNVVYHIINVVLIVMYIALIVVYSERNTPFDHEFFTRSTKESWLTTKQMMTSGFTLYIPFILYISIYFTAYSLIKKRLNIRKTFAIIYISFSIIASLFVKYANPSELSFHQIASYYLTCNKFSFWIYDSYTYFKNKGKFDAGNLTDKELAAEIDFYPKTQPFVFTDKEYPLMHKSSNKDVLGSFFNLGETPPNIVILVVEGLSKDFSGDKAYATSFTPFLDSLSHKSLAWDNFLSTAPGTFAAHPAISGSLPYGKRGFSALNIMPDHLSLIKVLKSNGYHTRFLIGFNPDFDNMGGYIRLQGTDMILSRYSKKYKEMGIGSEGWSMGYPDDALFSRSFEVMDSLKQTPYLDIYHTATTHMPYLFEQKPIYDKRFDAKIKTLNVSGSMHRTLKECKNVLVTYMFADDCIRKFFADYAKRPEYKNTIFFITGDHHIGSFPSTCDIDDYHVPLIVFSPMLKAPKKFYSVNTHNNLTPTILSLLTSNYKLPNVPNEVHWMADVMDTFAGFRNQQSMAFMSWSRDISDYIYKDYMLSYNKLYKLTPELMMDPVENDSMKKHITRLLDNYKIINSFVCSNNKIYPAAKLSQLESRKLLFEFNDSAQHKIYTFSSDTLVMPQFKLPKNYKYMYVEISANANLLTPGLDDQPSFSMSLIDDNIKEKDYLYWSQRDIVLMTKKEFVEHEWNAVSTNDMFTLDDYKNRKNMVFELAIYTQKKPLNMMFNHLKVKIYGVN